MMKTGALRNNLILKSAPRAQMAENPCDKLF